MISFINKRILSILFISSFAEMIFIAVFLEGLLSTFGALPSTQSLEQIESAYSTVQNGLNPGIQDATQVLLSWSILNIALGFDALFVKLKKMNTNYVTKTERAPHLGSTT